MRPAERYARDGYDVHEGIPAVEAGRLRAEIDGFIGAQAEEIGVDRATYLEVFCRWSTPNPNVQRLVDVLAEALQPKAESLLDAALRPGRATLFRKGGAAHRGTHGHQDAGYWGREGSAPYMATSWLTFDDVDASNGALQVIPGSHLGEVDAPVDFLAANFVDPAESWAGHGRTLMMRAGDGITFHPRLWHASHPTAPEGGRFALALRWLPRSGDLAAEPFAQHPPNGDFGMYTAGELVQAALTGLAGQPVSLSPDGIHWALEHRLADSLPNPPKAQAALRDLHLMLLGGPLHHAADQRGMVWDAIRELVVTPCARPWPGRTGTSLSSQAGAPTPASPTEPDPTG